MTDGGLLLVFSGPSGVGKTTIARAVEQRLGGTFSVSATTRPQASSDIQGRDYDFMSDEEFDRLCEADEFLEWACVYGRHKYGTLRAPVEQQLAEGRLVILEIDVQGACQVKEKMSDAYMIFVEPPSDEELLRRLRGRGRDSEEAIRRRFEEAKREIETARTCGAYEAFIMNDDLNQAIEQACKLVTRRRSVTAGRP